MMMTPFSSIFSQPAFGCGFHSPAFCQTFFYVQNPLVFASPERYFQASLRQKEGTIDQNIDGGEQLPLVITTDKQLLKGVARVGSHFVAFFL